MHFAQVSATVHFCWLTAHLYEQQTFTGVFPGSQHACGTGNTPMNAFCPEQRCRVLVLAHCKYTYEDLLFTQVCSDPTPVHCNTVLGKRQSPLASAALQNRLPAGLCHCKYTYEDLLIIQLCNDPTQCTATLILAKSNHHWPVLLCNTGCQQACVTANTPMKIC